MCVAVQPVDGTARSWFDPAKQRVKRYPVSLEAETYPVEVERRAVLVTVD